MEEPAPTAAGLYGNAPFYPDMKVIPSHEPRARRRSNWRLFFFLDTTGWSESYHHWLEYTSLCRICVTISLFVIAYTRSLTDEPATRRQYQPPINNQSLSNNLQPEVANHQQEKQQTPNKWASYHLAKNQSMNTKTLRHHNQSRDFNHDHYSNQSLTRKLAINIVAKHSTPIELHIVSKLTSQN